MIRFEETFVNEGMLPMTIRITSGRDADIDSVAAWLAEHRPLIDAYLSAHGAVLLRGFDALNGAEPFSRALSALAAHLMDYIGGTAPRHTVLGNILTATDLPREYTLALHQEMAYTANPPDRVAFFCDIPPTEGGETTIADAREITRRLSPDIRERFERQGLRVRRTLPTPDMLHLRPGIPKAWPAVFGTHDPSEVERIADDKGWDIHWLPNGCLQLWQEMLPAFKTHPLTGERVWFNQAHYHTPDCTLKWAQRDGRTDHCELIRTAMADHPEMLDNVFHRDGSAVARDDSEHIWETLMAMEVPLKWQASDLLLLDNVLAMHGRLAYRGQRRILAALIRDTVVTH
ncbi:hypothetical protein WS67_05390 [Burkholderia singularis]|uniref:TauD/TfdA-like domain-containing protein n=2 Tax=Burkholderia singularis TaxID=1503053 RepID=A0A124P9R2_9BURK|nr:hypothetical protein WS67_05390 [Burkholderia singularis]